MKDATISPYTWIVIGFITAVCAVAVIATGVVVLTHLRHLASTLATVRDEVQPELNRLQEAAQVAQQELARISEASQQIRPS